MNWIIDTDAGVDDAIGIVMPFASNSYPDFELKAITTVGGNVRLDKVNVNVGAILDLLNIDIPFYSGCDRPLIERPQFAEEFHGMDGLGDAGLAKTNRKPQSKHSAIALTHFAREHEGDISIVALAPMTNIALACNLDPAFHKRVNKIIIMGGAWQARGNQSSAAEFNIAVDPESAKIVFDRFENIVMLPWEVSLDQIYPFERFHAFENSEKARARFIWAITRLTSKTLRENFGLNGFPLPDPFAVAIAIDESVITSDVRARVKIDVGHDAGRALTTLDFRVASPNTRVVTSVNLNRMIQMIECAWTI
jgi:purine nucleosidase